LRGAKRASVRASKAGEGAKRASPAWVPVVPPTQGTISAASRSLNVARRRRGRAARLIPFLLDSSVCLCFLVTSLRLHHTAFDAAIVDLDGTLVDTLDDFVAVLALTLHELGLPAVDRAFVATSIGKGSEHLIRETLRAVGADAGLYDAAWSAYQRHYDLVNGRHAQVFDGVEAGLRALRAQGLHLACLTNKPTAFAKVLLQQKGLASYFHVVFGGDAFERKKPDPLPLLRCCEALGSRPERTLMIGDSSNDARAARAAGCPVVLVTYGYNHGEPVREVEADGFVDRLDHLVLA
jgi:phosphoglycolate phosphatase